MMDNAFTQIVGKFKSQYPHLASKSVSEALYGATAIAIKLEDNRVVLYDSLTGTIIGG